MPSVENVKSIENYKEAGGGGGSPGTKAASGTTVHTSVLSPTEKQKL